MEPYDILAGYYDVLMEDVPYDPWSRRILELLASEGIPDGHLLELACGTGQMTERLSGAGYRITAVERSEGMIEQAQFRLAERLNRIQLIQADMADFRTKTRFDSAVCVCDGINYLTEEGALIRLLSALKDQLRAGGVFIFDLSTAYKFKHVLDGRTIAENHEDFAFIWENHYNTSGALLEFELAVFERHGELFSRTVEYHTQRAYDPEYLNAVCSKAGFELQGPWHEYTSEPARADSERVHYMVKFGGNS